jgi:competence protein ComEC
MQHSFWHQVPVIKLLLPFVTGIGLSMFYTLPIWVVLSSLALSVVLTLACYRFEKRYTRQWLLGFLVSMSMVWMGFALHRVHDARMANSFAATDTTASYWLVRINEQPLVKPSSVKMVCKVLGVVDSAGNTRKASGKLILYVSKQVVNPSIVYGRVLLVPVPLIKEVSEPQNPAEFNYKRYLGFHGIYHQAYIGKPEHILITSKVDANGLQSWVYDFQGFVRKVLMRNINSANETAVAQALLYGYDDDIDPETVQAYSNTGTLHVLAVSGMHVGIIYLILGGMLGWLSRWKSGEIFRQLIILAALWLYSLVCGMSPSILRATVMFSFIIIGNLLQTRSNVYNTLAASAFTLLCFDPNMLANVGFQLSYLAVLGIVFFQPLLYNLYTPNFWLMDEIWKITAVSLAAQLVTFPVGLLYFHQFPNCFLFSNLFIIPLTTIILYGGLILVAIGKLGWFAWLLGQVLYGLIYFTNQLVGWVEQIPFAYVNGIHISIFQTLVLYVVIVCATAYVLLFHKFWLQLALLAMVVFTGIGSYQHIVHGKQQLLVVYKVNRSTAIQLVSGQTGVLVLDSALCANSSKRRFHLQQHTWQQQINQQQMLVCTNQWQQYTLGKKSILLAGEGKPVCNHPVDYLLTSRFLQLDELKQTLAFNQLVLTSAVRAKHAKQMIEWCKQNGIAVYDVGSKGAFVANLQ